MLGLSYDNQELVQSTHGVDASTLPSSSQRAAVLTLLDFKDEQIVAWIALLRPLQQGYQHLSSSQTLSSQQIDALSLLKDYPDVLVLQWLQANRYTEKPNSFRASHRNDHLSDPLNATLTLYTPRQSSFNSIAESSSSSLSPLTHYSRNTSGETSRTSTSQGDLSRYFARRPSNSTRAIPAATPANSTHSHWCIVCENPKALSTCDGWKRHMKEHEVIFPCMPHGPVQASGSGPQCSLCGASSPNQEHLDAHLTQQCIARPRSYTRKANLVKHLELHGVKDGSALADAWRIAFNKKYFSCGFCIALFDNLGDQLNHIDIDHFRRLEDICNWDMTKVIRGLLLQPLVDIAWHDISTNYTDLGFRWDVSPNRDLQLRLELAEEAPGILATAAFNGCEYDWSHHNYDEPGLTMRYATVPMDANTTMQLRAAALQNPNSTSSCKTAAITDPQYPVMSMSEEDYSDPSVSYLSLPQASFQGPIGPEVLNYQYPDANEMAPRCLLNVERSASAHTPMEGNGGAVPVQDKNTDDGSWDIRPSPNVTDSELSRVVHGTMNEINVQSSMDDRGGPGDSEQSSQRDRASPSRTSVSTPRRDKPPSIVSQLRKKFSSHKPKDLFSEPDLPMDIDLDGLMSFMEEEEYTRFERRMDR